MSAIVADPTSGTGNDLHRAEQLSIPVTLAVPLISFGALVAALVPQPPDDHRRVLAVVTYLDSA